MANEWHVPYELLSPETQDQARALQSLIEELEAIDWYHQRAAVTVDDALRRILEHHRDEEKEHATMLIEWLRRNDPRWDNELKTYLFGSGDIIEAESASMGRAEPVASPTSEVEAAPEPAEPEAAVEENTLTVGSLRPGRS